MGRGVVELTTQSRRPPRSSRCSLPTVVVWWSGQASSQERDEFSLLLQVKCPGARRARPPQFRTDPLQGRMSTTRNLDVQTLMEHAVHVEEVRLFYVAHMINESWVISVKDESA